MPHLSGKVEDQVVLVARTVVNCPAATIPPPLCSAAIPTAQISIDLRLGPFEQLGQDPVDVGDDVRGHPERELGGVNDYAQAIS
ncbi:MAG TPA: hypothetical protein VFO01_08455 [Trebonia sp.]|nr:hypothetical protein [Trebonia sp.]